MKQRLLFSAVLAALLAASVPVHAQLFGESDEVKAARQKHEDDQDAQLVQIPQLQAQIRELSEQVRSLTDSLARATGTNEELSHRLDLMNDKLDHQQKDFAYRLCMLSAQQLGADTDPSGLNCASAGTGSAPQTYAPGAALAPLGGDNGDAPMRGRPPGTLGTLSSSGLGGFSTGPGGASSAGNSGQFDVAMNLLAKAQYDEARVGFRAYADGNPGDVDLAPQAIFWVGDIDYVRDDYPNAARDFAELIKKYPTSTRAPDAMLKLGQSLLAMGQKSEGCTTLGALKSKFPNTTSGTLAAAQGVRKASCS